MMAEHDISTVVVVDENALLIGIVSERDLARRPIARKDLIAIPGQAREIVNSGEGRQPHGDVRRVEPARPKRAAVGD